MNTVETARQARDAHIRDMIELHFNPATGTPFWLGQVSALGFDPRDRIGGFDDLVTHFPNFDKNHLKRVPDSE